LQEASEYERPTKFKIGHLVQLKRCDEAGTQAVFVSIGHIVDIEAIFEGVDVDVQLSCLFLSVVEMRY